MKSPKSLLIFTLAAMPLLFPAGADAADLVLRRIDVAVGIAPLPIPVPVLVPEVRQRQPQVIYVRDGHDRQYRDRNHHADRRHRQEWNRHDRGNHRGHEKRQVVVIDRDDRRSCSTRPTTVIIADGRRR